MKNFVLDIFFSSILLFLASCNTPITNNDCARKHQVHLYATNWGRGNDSALAVIIIDSTIYLKSYVQVNKTGSENLAKIINMCEGPHSINIVFGNYRKDTVLAIHKNSSLLISRSYNPKLDLDENGITVNLLERDNKARGLD